MKIVCYLNFNGNCEAALKFYQAALGGEIVYMQRYGDSPMQVNDSYRNKVLHASFEFENNVIYASDVFEGSQIKRGDNMAITLEPDSEEQIEQIYKHLSEGATITMPLQDTFWDAKFASLIDKFGINWMLNFEKK